MKALGKIGAAAFAAALAVSMTGCAGGDAPEEKAAQPEAQQGAQAEPQQGAEPAADAGNGAAAQKDFDGSAYSDTGEGTMYLATAGGTSEGGNVPQIAGGGTLSIDVVTEGMDGSVCTVYVDGMENSTVNAGEMSQNGIVIGEGATEPGVHTVELVKMDGDAPAIYKVAQYEAV